MFRWIVILVLTAVLAEAVDTQKGIDAYRAGDYQNAYLILNKNAKTGDAEAQAYLGWLYRNGYGVPKNLNESLKWYLSAAKQGKTIAITQLFTKYMTAEGVKRNYVTAYALATFLVNKGDIEKGKSCQGTAMPFLYPDEIKKAEQLAKQPSKLWDLIGSEIK